VERVTSNKDALDDALLLDDILYERAVVGEVVTTANVNTFFIVLAILSIVKASMTSVSTCRYQATFRTYT